MSGGRSSALAEAPEVTGNTLDAVADLVFGRRIAVLTGAGVSTDSGIPDYRGEGAPRRTPMTFADFVSSAERRRRYWAGSHLGWRRFDAAQPNGGHRALARLEDAGIVSGVVTQNVDGLHMRAGSRHIVDLHGSMDRVVCLDCGQMFARASVAEQISQRNPWINDTDSIRLAPDGDVDISDYDEFVVPQCTVCGGTLKPDVVFFGEFVPVERYQEAVSLVRRADVLVIAGSSLVVNSGVRLLEQARRCRLPVVIINRGPTKGDSRATFKLNAGTTETLEALESRLTA